MNFQHYFATLLRKGTDISPNADEAMRDFQASQRLVAGIGLI